MSAPKIYTSQNFEPRLQILHEQMASVIKMLFNLTKARQVFLSFWDDEYSQIYDEENGFCQVGNFDGQQMKKKFKSLFSEVIYVPNARLHTLLQDIQFFAEADIEDHVFILPLINAKENRVGVLGLTMADEEPFDFNQIVNQIESVGQYILGLYNNQIERNSPSYSNKYNFDDLPASFLKFSVNENAQLLDCHYSKHLIRNHPAFRTYSGDSKKILEPLLQMDISSFTKMVLRSSSDQSIEYVYPFVVDEQEKKYFLIKLHVSFVGEGIYNCLAFISDITIHRTYSSTLDQILFDISHVMRRPVVSMKGLTNLIDLKEFDRREFFEIAGKIKIVSDEMEDYIRAMFKIYEAKQEASNHL